MRLNTLLKNALGFGTMMVTAAALADQVRTVDGYGPYYQAHVGGEFTLQVLTPTGDPHGAGPSGTLDPSISGYLAYYDTTTVNQYSGTIAYPAGNTLPNFQTFCVETGEIINQNSAPYDITIGQITQYGGGHPQVLTKGAALLYGEFASGILHGYDYTGAGRTADAVELQSAIWYLMNQITAAQMGVNEFYDLVYHQIGAAVWDPNQNSHGDTTYNVAVLNVWVQGKANQTKGARQDQLILTGEDGFNTPDGGLTVALLGTGLTALAAFGRRLRA